MPQHFTFIGKPALLNRILVKLNHAWPLIDGIVAVKGEWVTVSWVNGTVSDEYVGDIEVC